MCHFGYRENDEFEFTEETDEEEPDERAEFDDEYEEATDVRIVADGGDE